MALVVVCRLALSIVEYALLCSAGGSYLVEADVTGACYVVSSLWQPWLPQVI
jgi:hypothetical protein